jgi:hypothetical protein
MNNIEIIIAVIILLIIFLISINSSSNILLYINNNNVRFLMILSIIIIGHYDVNMAGLSGLFFLLLVNKANYIEGFNVSNSDKYANLRMWLYLMLINPISFDSKEKNVVRNEIDKLKFDPSCQDFVNQYRKLMDDNLAGNIAILIVNIDSEVSEINMIESYKQRKYYLKRMISDLKMFLNEKKIVEKEYLKNDRIVQMMKEKDISDNLSLIMDQFIPFLAANEQCLLSFLDTVADNLKTKSNKVDELKKKKMINNISQENAVEKTPEQKADDAKSAEVRASKARSIADQKITELNDAEYNAMKLKMYAEAKWVEAKASNAKKLADTKAAEAKVAEAKAAEAKANEEKSNQAKGLAEAESAKASLVAKSLVDEALRLKILALEAEEDAKVKANAYDAYNNKKKNESYADPKNAEKDRIVEAERQQKAEKDRIVEAERQQKAEKDRIVEAERQQKAEQERRVEAERQQKAEQERRVEAERQKAEAELYKRVQFGWGAKKV